jgi:flagellar assembly factor FliW
MDLSPSIPGAATAVPPNRPEPDTVASEPAPPAGTADEPEAFGPLTFPTGLPGFPDARAFRLRPLPGAAGFALLEAEEPDGPRFVVLEVAEPEIVFGPSAAAEATAALGIRRTDLVLFAIVTLSEGPSGRRAFVNLRAPVAVDRVGRRARQLVLADARLPLRHPLERRAVA